MPIDSRIPLAVRPPERPSIADLYARRDASDLSAQRLEAGEQQMRVGALQEQALTRQGEAATRAQQEEATLKALPQESWTLEGLTPVVGPERAANIRKGLDALDVANQARYKSTREVVRDSMLFMKDLPTDSMRAEAHQSVRANLISRGIIKAEDLPEQFDPVEFNEAIGFGVEPKPPIELNQNTRLVNQTTGATIAEGPTKPAAPVEVNQGAILVDTATGKEIARGLPKPPTASSASAGETSSQADEIADAIMSGVQPPILTGLYRLAGPVRAALAKKKYNLSTATQDFKATERYLSTLNGPAQVRLRQSTEFVSESLPLVRELSASLTAKLPRTRFPVLNKAALTAARNGLLGEDAQVIASQIESQIGDMQSELAVMFRSGNSPTDSSLVQASKMLQGDWSDAQLKGALDLLDRNVTIRLNSLRSVGAVANQGNAYQPNVEPPTPVPPIGQPGGAVPAHGAPAAAAAPKADPLGIR